MPLVHLYIRRKTDRQLIIAKNKIKTQNNTEENNREKKLKVFPFVLLHETGNSNRKRLFQCVSIFFLANFFDF